VNWPRVAADCEIFCNPKRFREAFAVAVNPYLDRACVMVVPRGRLERHEGSALSTGPNRWHSFVSEQAFHAITRVGKLSVSSSAYLPLVDQKQKHKA
jgi:hypothetical protein